MFPCVFPSLLSSVLSLCVCLLSVFVWAWLVPPTSGALLAGTPGPNLLIKLCSISTPVLLPVLARLFYHPVWYMLASLLVLIFASCVLASANLSSVSLQYSSASQPALCDHYPPVSLPAHSLCHYLPLEPWIHQAVPTSSPPALPRQPCHPVLCSCSINQLNLHLSQCSTFLGPLSNQPLTHGACCTDRERVRVMCLQSRRLCALPCATLFYFFFLFAASFCIPISPYNRD